MSGATPTEIFSASYISGSTLMSIPIWLTFNVDATMFVYHENKKVYSITTAERIIDLYWLPSIVLMPFFNHLTVINQVENKILNYFASEIINNKIY